MRDGRLRRFRRGLKRKSRLFVHDESAGEKAVFIEPAEVMKPTTVFANSGRQTTRYSHHTEFFKRTPSIITEILQSYEFLAEIDFIPCEAGFAIQIIV